MRFISLFAGIGGMDLGLERAGLTCVAQVEIDEFCRSVLARHWPDVPRFGDVRGVGKHNLPECDAIVGGFPCQPHSVAGERRGAEDERDMWPEFLRVLGEVRPRLALLENVPGLLVSDGGRFFGRVLGDLAEIGFDAEWSLLSACSMGAPHVRQRLFVVAHADRFDGRKRFRDSIARAEWTLQALYGSTSPRVGWTARMANPSELYGSADGVPNRLERNRMIGNAVVPQVAEAIGRAIIDSMAPDSAAMGER